ncbi:MAG: peroxiredoxin [Henriciella sp.]|nr:peroxiredoxin [Henriciella sp.]
MTNRLEKGGTAPAITLPAIVRETVNLAAPLNKAQVVFFYPKDNTKGCTTEAIAFSALKSEFDALGVEIIGVSKDSLKSHRNFRTKHDLTVTLASDEDGIACEGFGVWVEKNLYGRKYMGIQRSTFLVLADGTIAEAWHKVRVAGHAETVLETTQDLLKFI